MDYFIGAYRAGDDLGLVLLVASGATLALWGLSDSVDSAPRYKTLRRIGADEGNISRFLLVQTGLIILLPLAHAFAETELAAEHLFPPLY